MLRIPSASLSPFLQFHISKTLQVPSVPSQSYGGCHPFFVKGNSIENLAHSLCAIFADPMVVAVFSLSEVGLLKTLRVPGSSGCFAHL